MFHSLLAWGQVNLDSIWQQVKSLPDDSSKVNSLNTLSRNYFDLPNYEKALILGKQSLILAEKVKFGKGMAQAHNNIGNSYYGLEQYDKALIHHNKALSIRLDLGNKKEISASYNNIGNAYEGKSDYSMALENKLKALKLREEIKDTMGIARSSNNIANIYLSLRAFDKAIEYITRSQNLYARLNDAEGVTLSYLTAANAYKEQGNYALSNKFAQRTLAMADSLGLLEYSWKAHGILYGNYSRIDDPGRKLYHYEKYIAIRDSIYNIERAQQLAEEESKMEFEKREQALKFEHERKNTLAEEEKKRQRIVIYSAIAGLLLVLAFAVYIFRSLKIAQGQKKIIEAQKSRIAQQRELADSRRIIAEEQREVITAKKAEVEKAKQIIEQHNKDITDSIHYASRIQRALFTSDEYIGQHLTDYFVLFKPKDIVSGDFYWAFGSDGSDRRNTFYFACCDCTGHGVPGAFMSLLNISFLNEAVMQREIYEPEQILNSVRSNVVKALAPAKDGMDATLCMIDLESKMLYASCANNPVWLFQNGVINEIEPDKMPVGSHDKMNTSFTKHVIKLQAGDIIYAFTDGYADQFGGPKNKKFRYKQLEEVLLANSSLPMSEQKEKLNTIFDDWKGDNEQVDDVLIIGVKIN